MLYSSTWEDPHSHQAEMDASEWSSGCESGWTVYLDESSLSPATRCQRASRKSVIHHHQQSYGANGDDEEDQEGLSMVSDASSGPRHFRHEADVEVDSCQRSQLCRPPSAEKTKKKKTKKKAKDKIEHSFLDDTASSPAHACPNRCIDPSNNHPSAYHFYGLSDGNEYMGNPAFGFWQSSQQDPAEPSRLQGRRRR